MLNCPSPNHDARPPGGVIDMLILHYTGMRSGEEALQALRDKTRKVSAHYLIEEDGRVFSLVEESRRAWHAGESCWRGERDINARSIGIELVNPGHEWGYRGFPEAQMHALTELAREIRARHPIPNRNVLGHSDVAPLRKQDPGELFDWPTLAEAGVGLWVWPLPSKEDKARADLPALRRELHRFGYGISQQGESVDAELVAVVSAFQRHFLPWRVDGQADGETRATLRRILALAEEEEV